MLDRLIHALVESENEAADALLLEAIALGTAAEKSVALDALLRRETVRGLCGVIARYEQLPQDLQLHVLGNIRSFHHALREAGRSDDTELRLSAMKLIALGRQGKLAYVLSENLHETDETLSKAATEAMVALARWVSTETRGLQKGLGFRVQGSGKTESSPSSYAALIENRPEIEAAVARAMDVHRGRHGQELLRACLSCATGRAARRWRS
jgi:hypothetical protein